MGIQINGTNDTISATDNSLSVVSSESTFSGISTFTSNLVVTGSTSNDLVRITQTGSGNALVVEDSANPDSTPFVVNASGSVGIGTDNPIFELDLRQTGQADLLIGSYNAGGARLMLDGDSDGDGSGGDFCEIVADTSGDLTINARNPASDAEMIFKTGGGTERLRIDASGNTGIGTDNPDRLLHLGSTGAPVIKISDYDTGVPAPSYAEMSFNGGNMVFSADAGNVSGSTRVAFEIDGSEKLRITSGGAIGIGTLSPEQPNVAGMHIHSTNNDDCRIAFSTPNKSSSRIGYYGLSNNFGIDVQNGFQIRDAANSSATRLYIDSTGRLFFSAQSVTAPTMYFNPDSGGGYFVKDTNSTNSRNAFLFNNPNGTVGSISTNANTTVFSTSSDYRLKENVVDITDAITRLYQLNPCRFNFITDSDKTVDGFIAHEVQSVVPEAITGEKDAVDDDGNPVYQGIDQSKLVPLLTAALQEAVGRIETLEAEVAALKAQ